MFGLFRSRPLFASLLASIVFGGVHSVIQFQDDNVPHCPNDQVEYQCTVSGSGLLVLTWTVFRDDGTPLGSDVVYVSSTTQDPDTIGGLFTVEQLSETPLVSNISFTSMPSIDRYTVVCEDTSAMSNETVLINIAGIPASPQNLTIYTDTFTSSSVSISWTVSSSNCVTGYRYNVSSTIVQSTSDPAVTTVTVEGLVPSDDQYCVVVTTIDTANRYSSDSDTVCLYFNIPPQPVITCISNVTESATTDSITVQWTLNLDSDVIAPVVNVTVSIFNTTDDGDEDFYDESDLLPPHITSYTFSGVPKERNYTIELFAINVIGDSFTAQFFPMAENSTTMKPSVTISSTSTAMSTTSTTMMMMMSTVTSTGTSTPTSLAPSNSMVIKVEGSSNTGAIAGGVAGGIILLLLAVVIMLVVVMYCQFMKKNRKSDLFGGDSNKVMVQSIQLKEKDPEIGDALYNQVDGGESKPTETPTYQDPSTIKREQAPTGDLYALPEKKRSVAEDKPQASLYAELDLPKKTAASTPTAQPVVVGGQESTIEPVVYSDIRPQQQL